MRKHRVLAIGLDGYEPSLEDRLVAAGELPGMAALRQRSARFRLDHGPAQRTGLAWEHFSSGRSPQAAGRWAAVTFDPQRYMAWQDGTSLTPFVAGLQAQTVVFDAPYFELAKAPRARGVVNWGAHDPGVAPGARPHQLLNELQSRFGPYPAAEWIYGFAWPSAERCREMGSRLAQATEVRARAAQWLLAERLPDWELALVVVSEPHSAIEGLWHGLDPAHPLHALPSAAPAGEGLRAVYRATDRLVSDLAQTFPDATMVVFSMGGMGPNRSDAASMCLLPELLYRHAFHRPLMRQPPEWSAAFDGIPMLAEGDGWSRAVNSLIPAPAPDDGPMRRAASRAMPNPLKRVARWAMTGRRRSHSSSALALGWMPALRYRPYWHAMRAFALPSFYDGRVRINLADREREGKVPPSEYTRTCDEIEALLRACVDPRTGESVVDSVERPADGRDPRTLGATESDLVIVWTGPLAFDHPALGRIGPVPFRRTGGHTGPAGMAYLAGESLVPGEYGVRGSFDVVPTLVRLLGATLPAGLSGASFLDSAIGDA